MINRREFLGMTAGAGATLALSPQLLRAIQLQQGGKLIQRAIPSTGEKLPVIGLTLANHSACADPALLKEVLKTFVDNGGRVFDAAHQSSPAAEDVTVRIVNELGVQNKLFFSWRGTPPPVPPGGGRGGPATPPPPPSPEDIKAYVESLLVKFKVQKLDLVMASPQQLPVLKEMKKAGRVRYIGVGATGNPDYSQLASIMIMRNEPIDFIGVNYTIASVNSYPIANRAVEETILPLAQERKIGVIGYFPFGGANGLSCASDAGLFARVANTPLPEWAAEFDAKTWAQFFLKYVVSHPAITSVRVGTTKATHMLDDIGGGIGRLPNEATRKRMADFFDALPPVSAPQRGGPPPGAQTPGIALPVAVLERYAGEYKSAGGVTAMVRVDGDRLLMKFGPNPEGPLVARTETRFSGPPGVFFEFQLDAQGKVRSVTLEQGPSRLWMERK